MPFFYIVKRPAVATERTIRHEAKLHITAMGAVASHTVTIEQWELVLMPLAVILRVERFNHEVVDDGRKRIVGFNRSRTRGRILFDSCFRLTQIGFDCLLKLDELRLGHRPIQWRAEWVVTS